MGLSLDQESAYERMLTANLSRVIDWIKYGDAKNAALLAFASVWLAGIGNLILAAEEKHSPPLIVALLVVSAMSFLIGATCAVSALSPITNPFQRLREARLARRWFFTPKPKARPNLTYFGQIRNLEPQAFRDQLSLYYRAKGQRITTDEYINDLCSQTVINSRIATRKFRLFDCGAVGVLFGLMIVFLAVVVAALRVVF